MPRKSIGIEKVRTAIDLGKRAKNVKDNEAVIRDLDKRQREDLTKMAGIVRVTGRPNKTLFAKIKKRRETIDGQKRILEMAKQNLRRARPKARRLRDAASVNRASKSGAQDYLRRHAGQ